MKEYIVSMPAVGQVVRELIRCRDCAHYDENGYCDRQWTTQGDNWFCADGEKEVKGND